MHFIHSFYLIILFLHCIHSFYLFIYTIYLFTLLFSDCSLFFVLICTSSEGYTTQKNKEHHRTHPCLYKKLRKSGTNLGVEVRKLVVVSGGYQTADPAPDSAPREERERRAGRLEGSQKPSYFD